MLEVKTFAVPELKITLKSVPLMGIPKLYVSGGEGIDILEYYYQDSLYGFAVESVMFDKSGVPVPEQKNTHGIKKLNVLRNSIMVEL